MDWNLVLEFLKVLLTAPVMAAGATLFICVLFKTEIRSLLNRAFNLKLPGGFEVSASQAKISAQEESDGERPKPQISDVNSSLPSGLTPQQQEEIGQLLLSARADSYLWEYRYLNRFLVYQTQQVLDWLVSFPQTATIRLYDTIWLPQIQVAVERNAILHALEAHHLILITGDKIEVTEKGKEYQHWRGPLPSLPLLPQ